MHQYINLCPYLTAHVCSTQFEQFHENMGAPVWHCVFVTISLFLVTHHCQNVYMHQYMYLCSSDSPFQFDALWIVTWKDVCACVALCVCSNYSILGNTPWFKCVHASVHVFMFIWLPISVWCPVDSYMERCVPLCGSIFVSHSPHYVASTCMECVHAPVHVLMWTWVLNSAPSPIHSYFGSSVWQCVYCSYLFSVSTPCLECVHALVHVFMSTWLPMLAPPHLNSYMKT